MSFLGGVAQALVTEPPGVRASVQEAVGSLAAAYRGCTGGRLPTIAPPQACEQRQLIWFQLACEKRDKASK